MRPPVSGKPLLFCDIDGVLSLFGFPAHSVPDGTWAQVDGIAHRLSARASRHLLDLSEAFEVVWCSGWEDRANDHLPHLLGVGPFPHLSFPVAAGAEHWKLASVEEYAGERPLAWIDDDLNEACHAWAERRSAPTLLVPTEPAVGLDDELAARLRAWAASIAETV
jgi:HAD domain in Swiss Army Knife RNA repair proteins